MKNLCLLLLSLSACATSQGPPPGGPASPERAGSSYELVVASELKWDQLNPARGDQSPMAADLWGDRKGRGATGYLLRPVDGFRSPPHVHNVSYRAVVIRGLLHNDVPSAEDLWMPVGSFWTQPKGAVHITAAKGRDTLAYIEIDEGPYLVYPPDKAFSNAEKPINLHASKIAWSNLKTDAAPGVRVARLWGEADDQKASGAFVHFPAGFVGTVQSHGSSLRAVVVQGSPIYRTPRETAGKSLTPGSYFSSKGKSRHHLSAGKAPCIVYLRATGTFEIAQHHPAS